MSRNPSALAVRNPLDTAAFRAWFGDSTLVDERGVPQLLYHSTYSKFHEFKITFGSDEHRRIGAHIGSLEAAHNRLDLKAIEDQLSRECSGPVGANVMPMYAKIEAPLRLDENRSGRWGVDDIMRAIMEKAEADGLAGISEGDIDDFMSDAFDIEAWLKDLSGESDGLDQHSPRVWSDHMDYAPGERSQLLIAFIAKLGFDGVVYSNEFEGGGDSYIVFDSAQLKSAFNRGDFDPANPNICMSRVIRERER